jgi:hypothetical protein
MQALSTPLIDPPHKLWQAPRTMNAKNRASYRYYRVN